MRRSTDVYAEHSEGAAGRGGARTLPAKLWKYMLDGGAGTSIKTEADPPEDDEDVDGKDGLVREFYRTPVVSFFPIQWRFRATLPAEFGAAAAAVER